MKIDTQILEDHQAKLTVEVEAEKLEEVKHRAAAKLARRVKIPGFRPGKAPYAVIQRSVGDAAILEQALDMLIDEIYPDVIKEADIHPYGPGRLENVASMEPLVLEFIVPLEADVILGDYRSLRKPYEPEPVTEQALDEALEGLRERQAIVEPVDRPVQSEDIVTIRIGAHVRGNEDDILLRETSFPIVIRSEPEEEFPFQGFSKNLIGLSAGDSGAVFHTFTSSKEEEDSDEESKKNLEAEFEYMVESVKSRTLPTLDDEFAQSFGEFETLEGLRADVRSALETQARERYNEAYDAQIIEETIAQTQFKYPPQMLENEIDQVVKDLMERLSRQKLDLDIYLKSRNMDMAALREELKPTAEQRVKRGLLLYELGKAEDIEVDQDELEQETTNTLQYLQRMLPERDARRLGNQDVRDNLESNVLVDLLTRRTIERLRDIFSGKLELVEEKPMVEGAEGVKLDSGDEPNMSAPSEEQPMESSSAQDTN